MSIFQPASEISTNHRCGNCAIMMDQVKWSRCQLCKTFHLCKLCQKIDYDTLPQSTLNKHRHMHQQQHLQDTLITTDSFGEVCFGDSETEEHPARSERRAREYERILREAKISNDYEMFIVMKTLLKNHPPADNRINSLIVQYHLTANERKINILSLDGGGKTADSLIDW